ncbi:MAG: hypothetical protein ACUZ8E_01700, partial [Candidatus Anammoxibacter sp.]
MEEAIFQPVALSVAIAVLAIYISIKISVITSVGNLERIRNYSIYQISKNNNPCELLELLSKLCRDGNVLLYKPDRSNKSLSYSFVFFLILSILSVFGPFISSRSNISEVILYLIFSASIAALALFLWYDFRYYRQYKDLGQRFPVPADFDEVESVNTIKVTV